MENAPGPAEDADYGEGMLASFFDPNDTDRRGLMVVRLAWWPTSDPTVRQLDWQCLVTGERVDYVTIYAFSTDTNLPDLAET